jgi:4-hydroxy-tetrahydrodipicolinate synthase
MTIKLDWLRGCATALVTPFKADGSVGAARMRSLVERQINEGVKILVPCGTTGESATMTLEEDQLVTRTTVEVAQGRAHVIAGIGSNNTAVAIENARARVDAGVDALLAVAPYYNKPTQAGLIKHFEAIAQAVPSVPIVLYNVPGRTSSNIQPATALQLAREIETIVAIKEASGDMSQIMTILRERPANFRVLSGDDALTFPLLALGAEGLISVASNEAPGMMSHMVNAALEGKWDDARTLHFRLLPLMDINFIESSPGPVKAAMRMMNLLEENFRLPLVPITDASCAKIREVLMQLNLLKEMPHVAA